MANPISVALGTWLLIAPLHDREVTSLKCTACLYGLAFSPDGTVVATGDGGWANSENNGVIRLWDNRNGNIKQAVGRHLRGVSALAFAPDGLIIASGGFEGSIILWNWAASKEVGRLVGHKGGVTSIDVSRDGLILASAGNDKVVTLWDLKTKRCLRSLSGHTEMISAISFAPDGRTLISGSSDLTTRIWDVDKGIELACLSHQGPVLSVAYATCGKFFATGTGGDFTGLDGNSNLTDINKALGAPGEVLVWDKDSRKVKFRFRVPKGQLTSIAFSPDSRILALGTTIWNKDFSPWTPQKVLPGDVLLWEPVTGRVETARMKPLEGVTCVRFSDNGRWLASASTDGFLRIQDFHDIIEKWDQK